MLVSPFPEMKSIVNQYDIGELLESHDPEIFAAQLDRMLMDPLRMERYRSNLIKAAEELCWENEEEKLIGLVDGRRGGQVDKRTGGRVLEIVSFDIPFPADYGGVVDVFYTLKALSEAGVGIRLHCFEYHRKPAPVLNELCEEVYYYPRRNRWASQLSFKPYIVNSRQSRLLLDRLMATNHPILFEGLHTCGWLAHPGLRKRLKIYRESNIEHDYYRHLAAATRSLPKKLFYLVESHRLKRFQSVLAMPISCSPYPGPTNPTSSICFPKNQSGFSPPSIKTKRYVRKPAQETMSCTREIWGLKRMSGLPLSLPEPSGPRRCLRW